MTKLSCCVPQEIKQEKGVQTEGKRRRLKCLLALAFLQFVTVPIISSNVGSIQHLFGAESRGRITVTLFYHIFVNGNLDPTETLAIVTEQLGQIGLAAKSTAHKYDWVLKYQSVGALGVTSASFINAKCRDLVAVDDNKTKLRCEPLGKHVMSGHEEVTLHQMHNFCTKSENQDSVVAYIHTKGSLHPRLMNQWWRFVLTRAALHESCLDAISSPTCDVCGLQFYPTWTPFFPGNFFSAKCSYLRKLLPVAEHERKLAAVIGSVEGSLGSTWTTLVYPWIDDIKGFERFSKEHWVGSHPHLKPCDMSMNISEVFADVVERGLPEALKLMEQSTALPAPRVSAREGNWKYLNLSALEQVTQHSVYQRPHEYFMLPGLLYRYYRLHQEFPPSDSWVWKWFPQGSEWRNKLEQVTLNTSWNESMLW